MAIGSRRVLLTITNDVAECRIHTAMILKIVSILSVVFLSVIEFDIFGKF